MHPKIQRRINKIKLAIARPDFDELDPDLIEALSIEPALYAKSAGLHGQQTDTSIKAHYAKTGVRRGLAAHPLQYRKGLIQKAISAGDALEIGPFFAPSLAGPNVDYFDVKDKPSLENLATSLGIFGLNVPDITYVSPFGDLSVVDRQYDAVFSAHCIEHQPDLVHHFQHVEGLLKPGASYCLAVPDMRFCFDHFSPQTSLDDILQAHDERRTNHTRENVEYHFLNRTHNDKIAHWLSKHGAPPAGEALAEQRRQMDAFLEATGDGYVDVHAWRVTPTRFLGILRELNARGLVNLLPDVVCGTPRGQFEFTAVLRKPAP